MGSDPSKSQQLQSAFPEFTVLPDLCLSSDNKYELIFVGKRDRKQIWTIKQTIKQPALLNYSATVQPQTRPYGDLNKCPHIIQIVECKKIDSLFYTLYEWPPLSLPQYLSQYPHPSRNFCINTLQNLCRVYGMLWKNCGGEGIDIRADNIRFYRDQGYGGFKVLTPSMTTTFSKKMEYRNKVQDLGDVLVLLIGKGNNVGDLLGFVEAKMRNKNVRTTGEVWDQIEREVNGVFGNGMRGSQISSTSTSRRQIENRSISPIPRSISPLPQPQTRPISPPPITFTTSSPRPHPLSQTPSNPLLHKTTLSPHKPTTPSTTLYHHPQIITHERKPSSNLSVTSYQYSGSTPGGNKFQQVSPIPGNKGEIYETIILDQSKVEKQISTVKLTASPYSPIASPSPITYDRNRPTPSNPTQPQNPPSHQPSPFPSPTFSPSQNSPSPLPSKPFLKSTLKIPIMFTPSLPDPISIKSRVGVPVVGYVGKTKPDCPTGEEQVKVSDSVKGSLKLFESNQEDNFIEKHLMPGNNQSRELLGSSITVLEDKDDKQESFGFTVSEDSIDSGINYEGIYEGDFHPNFPTIRHGKGKLIFPSGGCYCGDFILNKMQGFGKLFYPSGRLAYTGQWKGSKFEGKGKLFNECPKHIPKFSPYNFNKVTGQEEGHDGYWKYYEGGMKGDMKEGWGVLVLENGERFSGQFKEDFVHGKGVFEGKDGRIEGIWEKGILVQEK